MQVEVLQPSAKVALLRRAQLGASGLVVALVVATYVLRLTEGAGWPLSHPYPALTLVPLAGLIAVFGRRSLLGFTAMAVALTTSAGLWFYANLP